MTVSPDQRIVNSKIPEQLSIFWFIPSSRNSLELISQLKCRSRLSGCQACPQHRPHQTTLVSHCISPHLPRSLPAATSPSWRVESWSNVVRMMGSSWSITGVFSKGEYTNYVYHNRREESLLSLGATFHHLSHHLYGEKRKQLEAPTEAWEMGGGRREIETDRDNSPS